MQNRNRSVIIRAIAVLFTLSLGSSPMLPRPAAAQVATNGWQTIANVLPSDVTISSLFFFPRSTGATPSGYPATVMVGYNGAGQGVVYFVTLGSPYAYWSGTLAQTFPVPLRAVVAPGNENIWAVGDAGLIVHDQGEAGNWQQITSPAPNADLHTIQMFGNGEEGWAAGSVLDSANQQHPVLLHYKNGQWQQDMSITGSGDIAALHFAADGGWLVGSVGIWRYHAGSWSKETEPAPCGDGGCVSNLTAVRAISGDEAWAFGSRVGTCAICVPTPYAIHRINGSWQVVLPDTNIGGTPPSTENYNNYSLNGAYFTDANNGLVVGTVVHSITRTSVARASALILRYHNGQWSYDNAPADISIGLINSVYAASPDEAVAAGENGLVLTDGFTNNTTNPLAANPATRVEDPHDPNVTYFAQTGHTLRGSFRDYWQQHGGLAQFGYPLTEVFTETSTADSKPYQVQYFERNRFEYHPENQPPYNVELGLLGRDITKGRENEAPFQRQPAMANPVAQYFSTTGHNMMPPFRDYWARHGGLAVYGYPISEAFTEVSKTDGKRYTVQYFERNRFEYHPELPDPYKVSLGLLGLQALQQRGWMP